MFVFISSPAKKMKSIKTHSDLPLEGKFQGQIRAGTKYYFKYFKLSLIERPGRTEPIEWPPCRLKQTLEVLEQFQIVFDPKSGSYNISSS